MLKMIKKEKDKKMIQNKPKTLMHITMGINLENMLR